MWLDVQELVFDAINEAKFADHGVGVMEVLDVLDLEPRFFVNRRARRASHVMVGRTHSGRVLIVPIEDWVVVSGDRSRRSKRTRRRSAGMGARYE